ncbi:coiled-coil domain-containing protein 42-like [Corvus hawaiiensis]|uniref:coiled-coil domain-containing protein 42-like n=1 Tax=Corvus hawaiiensis TaxID=134902 RepID=UPI002019FB9B|nr:coiled-coil domain-containing protein 42-like [Corvus hawaiiensis]
METWSNEKSARFLRMYTVELPPLLRWDLRWCWDAFSHHPTQDTVQHPEQSNTLPRNSTQCNPKENSCGRELTVTEDDSPYSLIRLLKKKEAQEMEKALAEKYKASRERMKVIADQWRDLHAKRAQLKAYVERCGRTIQEREELRIQALEINSQQREEKMKKDGKLLRAKMELEALRKKHWKLCKRVQKCSIFKEDLENVVKFSQFEDISEVTSWYKLLVRTQKDLMQSQQGHKQLTEQDKVLLEQYRAEKEAEMLQYKNELVQFKLHFDQAQSDIPLWEAHWADIQSKTSEKTRKLWTIKLAIHNLFQSTNMWLQAEWNVLKYDSCRQLKMVKPRQKEEQ